MLCASRDQLGRLTPATDSSNHCIMSQTSVLLEKAACRTKATHKKNPKCILSQQPVVTTLVVMFPMLQVLNNWTKDIAFSLNPSQLWRGNGLVVSVVRGGPELCSHGESLTSYQVGLSQRCLPIKLPTAGHDNTVVGQLSIFLSQVSTWIAR